MDARRRVGPQDLLDMKEQAVALALSMSGQFDEQIATMREAKVQLENTQLVLRTLAEAEQIKHAAIEFSAGERAQVEGIVAEAEEHRLEILSRVGEAKAVLDRATQEKDSTVSGWIDLDREKTKWEKSRLHQESELQRRQEMFAEREAGLNAEYERLKLLQDKLASRLRALEVV